MTHDMWHMTPYTLGGMNILSKFQLSSSYCFWIMLFEDMEEKAYLLTDWISDKAVFCQNPITAKFMWTAIVIDTRQ